MPEDVNLVKAWQPEDPEFRLRGFLNELKGLTEKWGISLHGCGCCYAIHDERSNNAWQYLDRDADGNYQPDIVL